jgi:hypothetical protein
MLSSFYIINSHLHPIIASPDAFNFGFKTTHLFID